jgi:sterol desaturase/sphingolipid hydroxylase (fatty acid hydroxylase superfamily)
VSDITAIEFAKAGLPAALRRAAPLAVLCLLFAVGAGLGLVDEAQQAYRAILSAAMKTHLAAGDMTGLLQAALLLTAWMLWRIARKLALFAAFFLAERALPGNLMERESIRLALAVQVFLACLYAAGGTILLVAAPFHAMPEPMVHLRQAEIESLLGPMTPVAGALAAMLAYDFLDYWVHRAWHHFPFLWRFHAVHHSIEHLDSLNSYAHPVDLLTATAAFVALSLLIGFSFKTVLLILAFRTIQGRLAHTSAPVNFGPFGALLIDNRTHFLHHVRTEARSGKNFAGTFTIFDRLFGTYERPNPGPLTETGLEEMGPPSTLWRFLLAKLSPARGTSPSA